MAGADLSDVHLESKQSLSSLIKENDRLKKQFSQAKTFSVACAIVAIVALAAIIAIAINFSIADETPDDDEPKMCGKTPSGLATPRIRIEEPYSPGPLHDVTGREINLIREYLKAENIINVKPEDAMSANASIYTIDLEPPNKTSMLKYLDSNGEAPARFARVYLFRGDLSIPVVEERLCGPLNNLSSCDVDRTSPFAYRPIENREYNAYEVKLLPDIQTQFGSILSESFGGSFDYENCEDDCFDWWASLVSSNVYGDVNGRRIWLTPTYDHPLYSLFPVDMSFLCNVDGTDPSLFSWEKVYYSGEIFDDFLVLNTSYSSKSITKINQTYPTETEAEFATLEQKGRVKPSKNLRPPELIEPDGKRYNIHQRKVDYLDMWSFDFRNSPIYGPLLYDVRFLGERIIYEISLQEIASLYSGPIDPFTVQTFLNSAFLTGGKSKVLVPGIDCPKTATFLPITVTAQDREQPAVFNKAICIFEQNSGSPLRRHHSYPQDEFAFYGGMADSSLVMRSIHTLDNVDVVIDFTFHQNGVIGVSLVPTGYLSTAAWSAQNQAKYRNYGYHIHSSLFGPMFQLVASFKVDLDVGGVTSNSYETMTISEETIILKKTTPGRSYSQNRIVYNDKASEIDAAYKLNFDEPVEHIFSSGITNSNGEKKSYRIMNNSPTKKLMMNNVGPESSLAWARYQLAVTKRKETEQRSGTFYSQYDGRDPAVDFERFIQDNDTITNEDLVAWVTIGDHHIPTSEDLPTMTTVGREKSFYIMPYNYFSHDPSMASRDAVFIDLKDPSKPADGLSFEFYGTSDVSNEKLGGACTYKPFDMTKIWKNQPDEIFEVNYNKGVY